MRNLICLLNGTILLLMSNLAWSGTDNGFYIGGSIGSTDQEVDTSELSYADAATGKKGYIGFNFGELPLLDIAVEASYVDFGDVSALSIGGTAFSNLTGVNGFGLVGVKLGNFGIFAKTGVISWNSEFDLQGTILENSGNEAMYGAGVKLQLGSLAIRAEYEIVETDTIEIDLYTAGISWTF